MNIPTSLLREGVMYLVHTSRSDKVFLSIGKNKNKNFIAKDISFTHNEKPFHIKRYALIIKEQVFPAELARIPCQLKVDRFHRVEKSCS